MFWDNYNNVNEYSRLQVKAAVAQKRLIDTGGKSSPELETIRNQLKKYERENFLPGGSGWYNIDVGDIAEWIYANSYLPDGMYDNGWNYCHKISEDGANGRYLVFIEGEGHKSQFSTEQFWSSTINSKYSDDEREQKVRNFNNIITTIELTDMLAPDHKIYSVLSGQTYNSADEYYLSGEHIAMRMLASSSYSESLYTENITNEMYVSSLSKHYKALYKVAELCVSDYGRLEYIRTNRFKLIGKQGDYSDYLYEELFKYMDASVLCAKYIAKADYIKEVPFEMFDVKGAVTYEETLSKAAVLTCLADKLI